MELIDILSLSRGLPVCGDPYFLPGVLLYYYT